MTEGIRCAFAVFLIAMLGAAAAPGSALAADPPGGSGSSAVERGTPPAGETTTPHAGPQQSAAAPGATPAGDAHVHVAAPQEDPNAASTPSEECPCHEHDAEPAAAGQAATPPEAPDAPGHACPHRGEGPCPCQQGDAASRAPTGEPHNGPPQVLVLTLAPAALGTFQATNTWRAGGVLMIAVPVAWHELELQVDIGFFGGPAGLASALDFLVKRPFRVNEAWRPYIGIGPSISLERLNSQPRDTSTSTFGVTGTGGVYYWFTGECAAMAYAEYTAVFAKQFRNALQLGFGVSYAFTAD